MTASYAALSKGSLFGHGLEGFSSARNAVKARLLASTYGKKEPMPTEKKIREELQRVVESGRFAASGRLPQFLQHIVEVALAGQNERLRGPVLAAELFQRGDEFDPRLDPIVRVEARRLRKRLEEYYSGEGANHAIRIEIPRGAYVPVFREINPVPRKAFRSSATQPGEESLKGERGGGTSAMYSSSVPAEHLVTVKSPGNWIYFAVVSLIGISSIWILSSRRSSD